MPVPSGWPGRGWPQRNVRTTAQAIDLPSLPQGGSRLEQCRCSTRAAGCRSNHRQLAQPCRAEWTACSGAATCSRLSFPRLRCPARAITKGDSPTFGKLRIAQLMARAELQLSAATAKRMLERRNTTPGPSNAEPSKPAETDSCRTAWDSGSHGFLSPSCRGGLSATGS